MLEVILLSLLLLGVAILIALMVHLLYRTPSRQGEHQVALLSQLQHLDGNLKSTTESLRENLEKNFKGVERNLAEVKESSRQISRFAEQLHSLEHTLKNSQRRGAVGEYMLENILANVLPPEHYKMQYSFKKGALRPDAVIFLQDNHRVCIDAKFPLENYTRLFDALKEDKIEEGEVKKLVQRDLLNRVKETAKYVLPEEGTLDYAFMFLPSEALYYDILNGSISTSGERGNLLERAFNDYHVIIVSPTTLLAYLQTVHLGLRSLRIEKNAQEIVRHVGVLSAHLQKHEIAFHNVTKKLEEAVKKQEEAEKGYRQIDKDVTKITALSESNEES